MRHGRTIWNTEGRFQGHTDVPLSSSGRAEAQALADALASEGFDYAVSSDLTRALETAQAIAQRHTKLSIQSDARLRELFFGSWEGLRWEQIVQRYPMMRGVSHSSPGDYVIENGESFAAMRQRVAEFLDELRASPFQDALIVTHAGPLHALLHLVLAPDDEALAVRFQPGSITRLQLDVERAELMTLNDTAHLV